MPPIDEQNEPKRQIIALLLVVLMAVVLAFVTLFAMLYSWGPTGGYFAKNVLLSPEVMREMSFYDFNQKIKEKTKFVFDRVEFTYFSQTLNRLEKVTISQESYAKFYTLVGGDRSVRDPNDEIVRLFYQKNTPNLVVWVRFQNATGQSFPFQIIEFVVSDDYFRVELHQENLSTEWVYFYHPEIFQNFKRLL